MKLGDEQAATSSHRIERKFWLTPDESAEIEKIVARNLAADKHRDQGHEHQTVSTLYVDGARLPLIHAVLDGKPDRFKLRIRRYGYPPKGPAFFEYKGKQGTDVVKRRAEVPNKLVREILSSKDAEVAELDNDEELHHLKAFLKAAELVDGKPMFLTRARRLAFGSGSENDDRATFDRGMAGAKADGVNFDLPPENWIPFDTKVPSGVLLELKYSDGDEPTWMKQVTSHFDLTPVRHSKALHAAALVHGLKAEYDKWLERGR